MARIYLFDLDQRFREEIVHRLDLKNRDCRFLRIEDIQELEPISEDVPLYILSDNNFPHFHPDKTIVELHRSEKQKSAILESVPQGLALIRKRKIFWHNEGLVHLLGYSSKELKTIPIDTLCAEAELPHDPFAKFFPDEIDSDSYRSEKVLRRKDGELVHCLLSGSKIQIEDEAPALLLVFTDLTALWKTQNALRDSEKKYSTLVERSNEGVIMLQGKGTITFVNNRFCEITGFSREELLGKNFIHLVPEEMRDLLQQRHLERMRGHAVPDVYESQYLTKSGSRIDVEISAKVIRYQDKKTNMVYIRDISERKKKQLILQQTNRELEALNRLAKTINQTIEFEDLLQKILDMLLEILEMEHGAVYICDNHRRRLHLVIARGLPVQSDYRNRILPFQSLPHREELANNHTVYIHDLSNSQLPLPDVPEREGIQKLLIIPIVWKKKLLGIIQMYSGEGSGFSEENQGLVEKFKDQLGVAVENALLYTELQNRARRMTALSQAVMATNHLNECDTLLPEFARILVTDLEFCHSWIAVTDPKKNLLVAVASYGPNMPGEMKQLTIALDTTRPCPPLQCLRDNKPIIFHKAEEYPVPMYQQFFKSNEISSLFYVPIPGHERPQGVVGVTQKRNLPLEEDDITTLTLFAEQIHTGLENARLYQETKNNVKKMTRLQEMSRYMTSSLKLHEVLTFICKTMVDILGYDSSWIGLIQPLEQQLIPVTHFNLDRKYFKRLKRGTGKYSHLLGPLADLSRSKSPVIVRHVAELQGYDEFKQELTKLGYSSCAGFPLLVEDDFHGLLIIYSKEAGAVPETEIPLIETFVAQAAIAIKNAQLFEQTRKYAQEIEKKNKELEAFVYTVSHDLKAPIISLNGFASLLLSLHGEIFTGDTYFYLQRIKENVRLMETLINDLLDLSRIGRVIGKWEKFHVCEILDQVATGNFLQLQEKKLQLILPEELPEIAGDRGRIQQVFENLVQNAIKYSVPGHSKEIQILYTNKNNFHEFGVRDQGIGIPPAYQKKVFDLFYRLESEENEGTGIGLTITKRIIEHHGGKIWIESVPQKGTTVYFTFPKINTKRSS